MSGFGYGIQKSRATLRVSHGSVQWRITTPVSNYWKASAPFFVDLVQYSKRVVAETIPFLLVSRHVVNDQVRSIGKYVALFELTFDA